VALAQALLIGGCLLFQSFLHMRSVNLGFEPDDLVFTQFELFSERYEEGSARASTYREIVERVETLPGVEAVALSTTIPLNEGQLSLEFLIEGRPRPANLTDYP
jgi:hypothetical protein